MKVKIWGCRGSISSPLTTREYRDKLNEIFTLLDAGHVSSAEKKRDFLNNLPLYLRGTFGGNTSCVEVRDSQNTVIVLDTGTGARALGRNLSQDFPPGTEKTYSIIYSHTHWDHISGLMFFDPIFFNSSTVNFYSAYPNLEERLAIQQNPYFFPVDLHFMNAVKNFHVVAETTKLSIGNMSITFMALDHPGGSMGMRLTEGDSTFVYFTDSEFDFASDNNSFVMRMGDFLKGADLVFFDSQYHIKQVSEKVKWGHSSGMTAVDICAAAGVKQLVMFHHDPADDDKSVYGHMSELLKYRRLNLSKSNLDIMAGFEGQSFQLNP